MLLLAGYVSAQEERASAREEYVGEDGTREVRPVLATLEEEAVPAAGDVTFQTMGSGELGEDPNGEIGPEGLPCCSFCGRGSCGPFSWYIDQGVRVLAPGFQTKPRNIVYSFTPVATSSGTAFIPHMTNRSIHDTPEAGYDVTIGHHLWRTNDNNDYFLEFTYWGMYRWSASRTVTSTAELTGTNPTTQNPVTFGNLFSGFPTSVGGFNRADEQNISLETSLNNFELNTRITPRGRPDRLVLHPNGNWTRECQPGTYLSYLFGIRDLVIHERFAFHSQGVITDNGVPGDVSGDYKVWTHNNLFGCQVGGELMDRHCKWEWGGRATIGPFINYADQTTIAINSAASDPFATDPVNFHRQASRNPFSFVGDIDLVALYRLRPNLTLKASYNFLFITQLALASAQREFQANPPTNISTRNGIFAQGVTLGVEVGW